MSHWTELLADGAEKPIILEIHHPLQQKTDAPKPGDKFSAMDPRLRTDLERLVGDEAFVASHKKMVEDAGGDPFLIFFIGAEHWRGKDPDTGKVDPPGREVNITVHLPASAAPTQLEEAAVTQKVMEWIDGSELGKSLRRVAQGRISHISARGRRYDRKEDIGQIVRPEDLQHMVHK